MLRGENILKAIKPYYDLKKLTLAHLCFFFFFINLVQQNWFNILKYSRLANTQWREDTRLGKAFLQEAQLHWGRRGGFSAMTTFSLQTSCLCQSNHQLCRMVCTPSVSHQCLGDPSKLALKVNIFFAHQVYLLWPRINLLRMVGR